jgi:hypothetical protein
LESQGSIANGELVQNENNVSGLKNKKVALKGLFIGYDNLLEEIFLERRRELAFENFLLFDIARYHKDVERDKGCIASVCTMPYPSDYYVLPIPEKTVLLNEFMQQNDGY